MDATTTTTDTLLTRSDLARITSLDPNTVEKLAAEGRLPKPIDLGTGRKALRWRKSDIDRWIAEGCQPVSEGAAR